MKNPLVSVIIPLYNQKEFVGEAISSVLNQSYSNIEVIVVNDGSTDNPSEMLKQFKKDIKLINQKNKGLAAARNSGIRQSRGEYIQLLDADDFLDKDKVRFQLDFNQSRGSNISYCEISSYDNDTGRYTPRNIGEVEDLFSHLFNFWYPYPLPIHSLLIKKDIFERFGLFDEDLKAAEDRYYFSKLAFNKVAFDYFQFMGGFRRLHSRNMNKDKIHIIENVILYYNKIIDEIDETDEKYFLEKFCYSGYEMMCANLTHLYSVRIIDGTSAKELSKIKDLLAAGGINFFSEPIPFELRKFKKEPMIFFSYLVKWKRKFKSFIKNTLGIRNIFKQ
jgi:glycosyltransferase involved in cell wall biosynthesis